ncbi:hypothetical protein [Hymenobacter koreensis]|uniref:hypothetical protein n=1 Tax=Hymenobacter koreensis TaxID=1084523 RepID=UPI0031EC5008
MNQAPESCSRFGRLALLLLVCLLITATPTAPADAATPATQVRVARNFCLAILRGEYAQAYALLAPEVRTGLTPARFQEVAQPLHEQGKRFGPTIDLYKLGVRIGDTDDSRFFYAFMFRSDTTAKVPKVQMDVTFRDSAATQVLSFTLIPAPQRTSPAVAPRSN